MFRCHSDGFDPTLIIRFYTNVWSLKQKQDLRSTKRFYFSPRWLLRISFVMKNLYGIKKNAKFSLVLLDIWTPSVYYQKATLKQSSSRLLISKPEATRSRKTLLHRPGKTHWVPKKDEKLGLGQNVNLCCKFTINFKTTRFFFHQNKLEMFYLLFHLCVKMSVMLCKKPV